MSSCKPDTVASVSNKGLAAFESDLAEQILLDKSSSIFAKGIALALDRILHGTL